MPYDFKSRSSLTATLNYFAARVAESFEARVEERVLEGLHVAAEAHGGQLRGDAEPYLVHPLRTALLMSEAAGVKSADLWIAALLHDALEDSPLRREKLESMFGSNVTRLVVAVTRVKPPSETAVQRRDGKISKWRATMLADEDVRLLKVCDNLDNVISWGFLSREDRAFGKIPRWLMEAEELYLPLADVTNRTLWEWMRREVDSYYLRGLRRGTWFSD